MVTHISHTENAYPVVGMVYKFILSSERRRLVCSHIEGERSFFTDIDSGYNLKAMTLKRFRYLLRNAVWSGGLHSIEEEKAIASGRYIGSDTILSLRVVLDEFNAVDEKGKEFINMHSRYDFDDVATDVEVFLDTYRDDEISFRKFEELKPKIASINGLIAFYARS
ncbi:MAG: hypothetical protein IJ800_01830 [Clostridia bacterium]|nr:hypothetical protein [Clostridia bacterium]